jgi:hypothetical protein
MYIPPEYRARTKSEQLASLRQSVQLDAVTVLSEVGGRMHGTELAQRIGIAARGLRQTLDPVPGIRFCHEPRQAGGEASLVVILEQASGCGAHRQGDD